VRIAHQLVMVRDAHPTNSSVGGDEMNNVIFVTLLVFGLAVGIPLSWAAIQAEDILGVWLLDEGSGKVVKDVSGNGYDGEVVAGNGKAEWTTGQFSKGIDLASGGHVMIPHDDSQNLVEFTISVWIKVPKVLDPYQYIAGKEEWPNRNYAMWIRPGVMTFGYTTPGAAQDIQVGSVEVTDNQWHHIVGVFNGEELVSYVDGVQRQQRGAGAKPATCNAPIKIGVQPPDTNGPTTGIIDEVAIFRRGLTEEEVAEVMEGLESRFFAVHRTGKLASKWGNVKKISVRISEGESR